uniref:EGF-like domain-containing protein n=1 Tax=Chromera velia CCMP2878 TaxID=1169474 RepID=A0A0G4I3H8_9ALVE|eukprot:Cvel_1749.t1-p1 / transcript=Cvel_1749.t1 / gene=Cvel_1749 / organism=Chromera_velia_CCMP2878 / gene_product=Protein glp-1, putative / transcript_product=Protein glp-1, putative / location=Cvel_scaffold64:15231-17101(-) / protein_length=361 / sequence_SO=supercontig / SO=protein_coding / is_pseudo=false
MKFFGAALACGAVSASAAFDFDKLDLNVQDLKLPFGNKDSEKDIKVKDDQSCYSNPCINGGVCVDTGKGPYEYYCSCPYPFYGRNCELTVAVDRCTEVECLNGGECIDVGGGPTGAGFVCNCQTGFSGKLCEVEDPCPTVCESGEQVQVAPFCPEGWISIPASMFDSMNNVRRCARPLTPVFFSNQDITGVNTASLCASTAGGDFNVPNGITPGLLAVDSLNVLETVVPFLPTDGAQNFFVDGFNTGGDCSGENPPPPNPTDWLFSGSRSVVPMPILGSAFANEGFVDFNNFGFWLSGQPDCRVGETGEDQPYLVLSQDTNVNGGSAIPFVGFGMRDVNPTFVGQGVICSYDAPFPPNVVA